MSFQILGTGSAAPAYVMTNEELATIVETNDEWIRTRSGIRERRICTTESITDLALKAVNEALEDAGVTPDELDLIICATLRGEFICPSQACVIQKHIGAHCPAFDVNAACSGFLFALDVADGYFVRKRVKKALVIGMDNLSNITDWQDRSTCVLFGDGGGAAVLGEGEGLLSMYITAKGDTESLVVPHGENSNPRYQIKSERSVVHMNGREVYKFAVNAMSAGLEKTIADAGLRQEDIDYVIPHQANIRIIEAAQHKLRIPKENYVCNIDRYGNTSAGSVPLALDELNKSGKLKRGQVIAMSAFGGGLTTASCVLRW